MTAYALEPDEIDAKLREVIHLLNIALDEDRRAKLEAQRNKPKAKAAPTPRRPKLSCTDLAEDVEFLLDNDPWLTCEQIRVRLGYANRTGVQHALKRARRQDLLAQLARNAEHQREAAA